MSLRIELFFLIPLLFAIQCTESKQEDLVLREAARIHNESVDLAEQVEVQLNHLVKDTTYQQDSVTSWRVALEQWENNLVEVPGNESHDTHRHEHHDHGKQLPELTSDQLLMIQQEVKAQLEAIRSRINSFKK